MTDIGRATVVLDAIAESRGPVTLTDLATRTTERLQHAEAFVRFSTQPGQVICTTDPDEAAARDARMIAGWAVGVKPPAPPGPASARASTPDPPADTWRTRAACASTVASRWCSTTRSAAPAP